MKPAGSIVAALWTAIVPALVAGGAVVVLGACASCQSTVQQTAMPQVASGAFDGVAEDPAAHRLYLADGANKKIDVVVGMESRGFIFAAPIAYKLGVGFVPVRKLGKLPGDVVSVEYDLEYGSATLEMHKDAMKPGARVLIVDDLLATGGTVAGTIELVKQLKGEIVGLAFLIELAALKGRDKLAGYEIATLIKY